MEFEKDYGETYLESYDEASDDYYEGYVPGSALALSKKNKIKDSISKAVAVSLKSNHASQYKRSQDGSNSLGEDISLGYYYYSSYGYYDYYYGTYYTTNSTLDWGWFFLTLLCCPCVIWYWCCAAAASSSSSSTNTAYVSSTVHDANGQPMQQPNYDPNLQMQQQNMMMGNQMQAPG